MSTPLIPSWKIGSPRMHAVGGTGRPAPHSPAEPDHDRRGPGEISDQVRGHEEEAGPGVALPRGPDARNETFGRQNADEPRRNRREREERIAKQREDGGD